MSATIGNLSEISHFLRADVYTRGFRPVELKEYIKCGKDLLRIDLNGKSLEDTFIYERTVNFKVIYIHIYTCFIFVIQYYYSIFNYSIVKRSCVQILTT